VRSTVAVAINSIQSVGAIIQAEEQYILAETNAEAGKGNLKRGRIQITLVWLFPSLQVLNVQERL
jgi:hypothetical protein